MSHPPFRLPSPTAAHAARQVALRRRHALAIGMAGAMGAFGLASPAFAETKLRIGLIGTNESAIPILLAIDRGFFRDEGIEVEPVYFKGGGVAVQAFIGGSIELASFASDHVLRIANRGGDARFLIGIDRFMTSTLVVPAGKGYKDLTALRGKRIGVSAPGSYSDNTIRWALKEQGINPDREVTIIGIGSGTTARAGLAAGQIDALIASTGEVLAFQLEEPGKFEILHDWRKVPHSGQAVIGRQKWIDENPKLAAGVARAVLKAEQLIQKDLAAVEKVIRKQYPNQGDAYVKAYTAVVPSLLSPDGRISEQGFVKMVEILRTVEPQLNPIKRSDVDLTDKLLGRPAA